MEKGHEGGYKDEKFTHYMSDGKAYYVWYDGYWDRDKFITFLKGHEEIHLSLEESEKIKAQFVQK